MTTTREYELPGGGVVELDGTIADLTDSGTDGPVRVHPEIAIERTIERWKTKPGFQALLASYTSVLQDVENVLWDVLVLRFLDYAFGASLNTLGKIVGVGRGPRTDPQYRARIKAQVAINASRGGADDVINVLRLVDAASFTFREYDPAFFRIEYLEPAPDFVQAEIPLIVRDARAAGVGASVLQPPDVTGVLAGAFNFGDGPDPAGTGLGFGNAGSGTYGGALSHYVVA